MNRNLARGLLGIGLITLYGRSLCAPPYPGADPAPGRDSPPAIASLPDSGVPGVKVCGVRDKPSVLAALSAAKETKTDNLVIGLLLGITHFSRETVAAGDAADLIRYIRTTAYSLNVPVRIACVTHHTEAGALIRMIRELTDGTLKGKNGLLERSEAIRRTFHYPDIGILAGTPVFDIIQIHDKMPLQDIQRVKKAYPEIKLMKAMHIPIVEESGGRDALIAQALELAEKPYIDALLLDSANPAKNQIGGTGLTNDWDAARAIIDAVHKGAGKPVALAGGLSAENVSEALTKTHADMVDANTGYRFDRAGSGWKTIDPAVSAPKDAFAILSMMRQTGGFSSDYSRRLFK